MDTINSGINRARRKLWVYGSVVLALIAGLAFLVGANGASAAHSGSLNVPQQLIEGDVPTLHLHVSETNEIHWAIHRSGTAVTNCGEIPDSRYKDDFDPVPYSAYISDVDLVGGEVTFYLKSAADQDTFCIRSGEKDDYRYHGPIKVDLSEPDLSSIDAAENNRMEITLEKDDSFTGSFVFSNSATGDFIRYGYVDASGDCDIDAVWSDQLATGTDYGVVSGSLGEIETKDFVFWIAAPYTQHGEYLCVAVADEVGNTAYVNKMVDVDFPLEFKQMKQSDDEWVVRVSSTESGVTFTPPSTPEAIQESNCNFVAHSTQLNPRAIYKSPQSYEYVHSDSAGGPVDDHVCVVAKDSKGNTIRTAFEIDREPLEIDGVYQNNDSVQVFASDGPRTAATTHTSNDGDPLDNRDQLTWDSVYVDVVTSSDEDDPDVDAVVEDACTMDNYGKDMPSENFRTYDTRDSDDIVDLNVRNRNYEGICFRVGDVSESYIYSVGFVIQPFDSSAPTIESAKGSEPNTIELTLEGATGTVTWNWDRDLDFGDECDMDANFDAEQSSTGVIEIEDSDSNYCVRATVGGENYYAFVLGLPEGESIDTDAPEVTVADADTNNMVMASSDNEDVDSDSWAYAILDSLDDAQDNCDAIPLVTIPDADWMDGDSFMVTAAHNNKAVCFRVKDETGNYGYNHAALPEVPDVTPPTLTVTQSGNTLSWNAEDAGGIATYEYQMFDAVPADCTTDSGWVDGRKVALAESDNGMHYCFRVTDYGDLTANSGPLTISGVDTTAPTITVSQSGNTVSAVPGEPGTDGWQHIRSDDDPGECKLLPWTDVKQVEEGRRITDLAVADSGKWICFRVMDAATNHGYKKFQIETITTEEETARPASDGSLQFSLEGRRLTVSLAPAEGETEAPEAISWNYLFFGSENGARNNCTAEKNQFAAVVPGTRNSFNVRTSDARGQQYVHLGKWFCFRAIDENNEEAFGVFQVPAQLSDGTATTTPPPTTIQPPDTTPPPVTQPPAGTDPGDSGQQPGGTDPGDGTQPGDGGTTTADPGDGGTTTDPGDDGTTTDPGDDGTTTDPVDEEGGFLSNYLWYIIGAVVVVILIVVFVAMGSKGNQRE